jgi:4'-phosphopantetheinyl transferase
MTQHSEPNSTSIHTPPARRPGPQVWLLWLDDTHTPELRRRYQAVLDSTERHHYQRLQRPAAQHSYLLTRVLVRTILSHYRPLPPSAWRFQPGPQGRPEIVNPQAQGLRFNVSHTQGLIACAVADHGEIGIDVESLQRNHDVLAIAQRFFSAHEYAALREHPTAQRQERFVAYWTLKEAYLKARGLGLSGGLRQFSVVFTSGQAIRLQFTTPLHDTAERWALWQASPDEHHRLAVCVEHTDTAAVPPRTQRVIPLVSRRDWPLVYTGAD